MYKFNASKPGHEFLFTAPSRDHESIVALQTIGYTVKVVMVLRDACRYVKAFGGVYEARVPQWVEVQS
jgi:hypothetical protein